MARETLMSSFQHVKYNMASPFIIALSLGLSGCGNMWGQMSAPSMRAAQPLELQRRSDNEVLSAQSIKRNVDPANIDRAIRRYVINKGKKDGPRKVIGADLTGNGNPELLVYFSGEEWCARTGCTLAVFVKEMRGFRAVSTIKRVKLPIIAQRSQTNGWRDLIVFTGLDGAREQRVILKFGGRGYPGNAVTLSVVPQGIPVDGEVLFAPTGTADEIAQTNQGTSTQ